MRTGTAGVCGQRFWSPHNGDALAVYVLLVLVHGWAWLLHTDGVHQIDRRAIVCPECEQDMARG